MAARLRSCSVSFLDVKSISAREMMSLRIEPLNGCGYSSFSNREIVLRLVPTSLASSSSENPALLRRMQRNVPKYLIAHFSQIASTALFQCVSICLTFSQNICSILNFPNHN